MDNDTQWDKILNIKTSGRDDTLSDFLRHPYEATPYCVLERLAFSGYITKKNTLVDYGCGKGRVDFFLSYQTGCHSIGIDFNERLINRAIVNKENASNRKKVEFYLSSAEDYSIPTYVDRLYFFNPFNVEILKKVINNLKESYEKLQRDILLFFYFPSSEYLIYLSEVENITLLDEIDVQDLFDENKDRERIIVLKYHK